MFIYKSTQTIETEYCRLPNNSTNEIYTLTHTAQLCMPQIQSATTLPDVIHWMRINSMYTHARIKFYLVTTNRS